GVVPVGGVEGVRPVEVLHVLHLGVDQEVVRGGDHGGGHELAVDAEGADGRRGCLQRVLAGDGGAAAAGGDEGGEDGALVLVGDQGAAEHADVEPGLPASALRRYHGGDFTGLADHGRLALQQPDARLARGEEGALARGGGLPGEADPGEARPVFSGGGEGAVL